MPTLMKIYKVDKSFCDYCLQVAKDTAKNSSCWQSSTVLWSEGIKNHIHGSCMVTQTPEILKEMILKELDGYLPKITKNGPIKRYATMFYVWQPYSGISKHSDYGYPFAATLYLNHTWDVDWGGNFLYYDGEIDWDRLKSDEEYMYNNENWKVVVPEIGTMVVNDNESLHLVTPIAPTCPEMRYTIQIWGMSEKGVPTV